MRFKLGVILIVLLLLGILYFVYINLADDLGVDYLIDECKGKRDGTVCNWGVWYDEFGRKCGGQSCVGLATGKCVKGRCEPNRVGD